MARDTGTGCQGRPHIRRRPAPPTTPRVRRRQASPLHPPKNVRVPTREHRATQRKSAGRPTRRGLRQTLTTVPFRPRLGDWNAGTTLRPTVSPSGTKAETSPTNSTKPLQQRANERRVDGLTAPDLNRDQFPPESEDQPNRRPRGRNASIQVGAATRGPRRRRAYDLAYARPARPSRPTMAARSAAGPGDSEGSTATRVGTGQGGNGARCGRAARRNCKNHNHLCHHATGGLRNGRPFN